MIIGGSFLFIIFQDFMKSIFFAYKEEGQVLNIFYQLGLIFLMFLSGFNTEIKVDKKNIKIVLLVFIGATIIPMIGAIPFINMFKSNFIGSINNDIAFSLVFCIGVAITMNARGGPGIVLATVAYSANIISLEFFTVLILTTMLSSLIAGYFLRYQQKLDKNIFNKLS